MFQKLKKKKKIKSTKNIKLNTAHIQWSVCTNKLIKMYQSTLMNMNINHQNIFSSRFYCIFGQTSSERTNTCHLGYKYHREFQCSHWSNTLEFTIDGFLKKCLHKITVKSNSVWLKTFDFANPSVNLSAMVRMLGEGFSTQWTRGLSAGSKPF